VNTELLSRIGKALEERTLVKDLTMTTDLESKSIYYGSSRVTVKMCYVNQNESLYDILPNSM
jgi:hypothetical protein